MKGLRIFSSGLLLLLMAWLTVPREYIHELFHTDASCHVHCTAAENDQITEAHAHCSYLNYSHSTNFIPVPGFTFVHEISFFVLPTELIAGVLFRYSHGYPLRGPPVLS